MEVSLESQFTKHGRLLRNYGLVAAQYLNTDHGQARTVSKRLHRLIMIAQQAQRKPKRNLMRIEIKR